MTEHTPGPWAKFPAAVKGMDGWRVLNGEHDVAHVYTQANARLIAATPDMLKELKWIAGRIDRNSGSPNFTSDEYDRICAAIAKAEGKS